MGSATTGWFNAGSNPTVETQCNLTLTRNINTITVNWSVDMRLPSSQSYLGTGSLEVYCSYGGITDHKTIKEHNEIWSDTSLNFVTGSFTFQDSSPTTQSFSFNFWSESDYFSSSGLFDIDLSCSVEGLPVATINSFTGNDITGNFKVNFTSYSDQFTYKLRLSIPNVVAVETFNNYSNNNDVQFSNSALQTLQSNMSGTNQVNIGAVIETWNGGTKVGESSELINICEWYPIRLKVSNNWKKGKVYVKVSNSWKEGIVYTKVNGTWKRSI